MSVYVDDMRAKFGRLIMCHMIADTHDELIAMVKKIGVSQRWAQSLGTYREHFDVCLTKRALAVQNGAIEITQRRLGEMLIEKRAAEKGAKP